MDLLKDRDWHNREELAAFLVDLDKANPNAKWTRQVERMGIDLADNVISDMFWFKAEIFKLNGQPVFEIVTKAAQQDFNDLRDTSETPDSQARKSRTMISQPI